MQFTSPSFGQLLCPSASFIQSHPHSLHYTTFVAKHFATGLGIPQPYSKLITAGCTIPSAILYTLTGFHYTSSSLIHFSRLQSTRCLLLLRSPAAPLRLRLPCGCNCSCRTSTAQCIAKAHLHSSAASVPPWGGNLLRRLPMLLPSPRKSGALLPAPLWGLAVRLHSVVPPSLRRP